MLRYVGLGTISYLSVSQPTRESEVAKFFREERNVRGLWRYAQSGGSFCGLPGYIMPSKGSEVGLPVLKEEERGCVLHVLLPLGVRSGFVSKSF